MDIAGCHQFSRQSGTPDEGSIICEGVTDAEVFWVNSTQLAEFSHEISTLKGGKELATDSKILMLRPFLDQRGLLRVGGRLNLSNWELAIQNLIILPGKERYTRLLVEEEHLRLLHAHPMLVVPSFSQKFHITGSCNYLRRHPWLCHLQTCGRPTSPSVVEATSSRQTKSRMVFDQEGLGYARPIVVKSGPVHRPVITKAYLCVFVSLLEAVSELTTAAFIACLRRFIAQRGKPMTFWSDHGMNFVGAARELKDL